jgi:hypothetical protein
MHFSLQNVELIQTLLREQHRVRNATNAKQPKLAQYYLSLEINRFSREILATA